MDLTQYELGNWKC